MALSGTVNGSVTLNSSIFSFYFTWSAKQNIAENYSDVTVTTYWKTKNTSYAFDTVGKRSASITINGTTTSISKVFAVYWSSNPYQIQTVTTKVPHNADGTKTITISASANGYANTYGASSSLSAPCTASASVTLDTIPRASSISSISNDKMVLNGSNALTVNIARASDSFTHTVKFQFGSSFSYTATGQGASCKYVIPLSWLAGFGTTASGTRTGTVTVTTYSGSTQIGSAVSKNFTLTSPSASAISWNTTNLVCNGTNTIGVSIVPTVSSFTHTVKWAFGSYTYSATGVGLSTSYAPPTSWLNAIQNANSGTGSVTVTTFNGTQQIGSAVSKNFTMSVPSYTPTLTSVTKTLVQDSSISDWTIYVQNKSKVKFTFVGANGKYGSQIKSYAVTINGVTYTSTTNTITTNALTSSGDVSYTATVTDSRNKTVTDSGTINVKAVIKPSLVSATIERYNGTAIDDEGTQIYFKFNYNFETYTNFNSTVNKVEYKESTSSSYIEYGSFKNGIATIIKPITFDITKSYDFRVNVTDELGSTLQYNYTVGTAKGLIDVDGINNSIGLLKMTSKKGTVEVGGALEVDDGLREFKGNYVHSFLSNGNGNYIKFATITITQNYADSVISFDIGGRGTNFKQKANVSIAFVSGATNDPALSYINVSGVNLKIYGVKTATSTWDFYCNDTWGWDRYTIYNMCSISTINQLNNQVLKYLDIDWHNVPATSVPSGAIESKTTYYYNGTSHVFSEPVFYPIGTSLRRCLPSDNMTHVRMIDSTKKYLEVASSLGTFGIDAWVSDVTLKENITETDVNNALDIITQLRHVQFDWRSNGEHVQIGYIADELEDLFSQLVFEVPQYDEEGNPTGETIKQIYNTTMIPLITKAMQELKAEIDRIFSEEGTLNMPTATTTTLGAVMVGDNLTIDANGKLSAIAQDFDVMSAQELTEMWNEVMS